MYWLTFGDTFGRGAFSVGSIVWCGVLSAGSIVKRKKSRDGGARVVCASCAYVPMRVWVREFLFVEDIPKRLRSRVLRYRRSYQRLFLGT